LFLLKVHKTKNPKSEEKKKQMGALRLPSFPLWTQGPCP
jgi:hypothetical protein